MRERLRALGPSAGAVLGSLLAGFAAVVVAKGWSTAVDGFGAMFAGAVGDWPRALETSDPGAVLRPLGEAGTKAALLGLCGLSVAVAFRVGLFNIGAQGQLMVGALAAAVVGAAPGIPGAAHLALALAAAAIVGASWALVAAALKLWRGVHEVISTIMLNWVAVSLVEGWLVAGPLRGGASGDNSVSGTAEVLDAAVLPRLLGESSRLNAGFLLAVLLALWAWLFLGRTVRGYEWRCVGLGPKAAYAAGIDTGRVVGEAMAASGALAGLAGAVLVLGTELKYPVTLASSYGFDGIAMALIGQGHPLGVLAASGVFGGLRAGGTRMQLFGIHRSFPELIQGLALLLVAARLPWARLARRLFPARAKGQERQ
jgi:general nucleoside transport system permease protein